MKSSDSLITILLLLALGYASYYIVMVWPEEEKKELNLEWTLFRQISSSQPFNKSSNLSLTECKTFGYEWMQKQENREGGYSCGRNCTLSDDNLLLECEDGYIYNKTGLKARDKISIAVDEIVGSE